MQTYVVETVDRVEDLERLRVRWERLYAADPHAHIFSSWAWQRAYWRTSPYAPFVAAVRHVPSGEYVAFAPFAREKWLARLAFGATLHLGGSPKADYTGLVADPAHETPAVAELVEYLDALKWVHAYFEDVRDPRVERIVDALRARGNSFVECAATPCLSIELPESFEAYLEAVSKKFRSQMRRALRAFAMMGAALEPATDETIDARIDRLIEFNHVRWQGNVARGRERFGKLFRNAYDAGCLQIFSLLRGEETIAALAVFFCEHERSYLAYMLGTNPAYARYSPGIGLHALLIRRAIERGCKIYDFTRGDEPYKLRFGVGTRFTRRIVLERRSLRASAAWAARGWRDTLKNAILRTLAASKSRTLLQAETRSK